MALSMISKAKEIFHQALVSSGPVHESARSAFFDATSPVSATKGREKESAYDQNKRTVEAAIRDLLLDVCVQPGSNTSAILTREAKRLLAVALWLADKELVDAGLPCTLIEDILDVCQTPVEIREVFSWMEENQVAITASSAFQKGKPALLRGCDNALDKIQGLENAAICGKILLQIAKMWGPQGSAINRDGCLKPNNRIVISIDETGPTLYDLQGIPVNREYYVKFWHLLQTFRDPNESSKASLWKDMKLVIHFLDMHPVKVQSTDSSLGIGREHSLVYNTDPKVFRTQLSDPAFRCHFLVECLLHIHSAESRLDGDKRWKQIAREIESTKSQVIESLHGLGDMGKITAKCMVQHLKSRPCGGSTKRRRNDGFSSGEKASDVKGGLEIDNRITKMENAGVVPAPHTKRRKKNECLEMGHQGRERDKQFFGIYDQSIPTLAGVCGIVDDIDSKTFCSHVNDDLVGTAMDPKKNTEYCWRVYRQLSSDINYKVDFDESLDLDLFVKSAVPPITSDKVAVGSSKSTGKNEVKTEGPNHH